MSDTPITSVAATPSHAEVVAANLGRPPLPLLAMVAVMSAAVLGFEVALTRVFAVLLRYHFAFLVVSIALCGLGVGGYVAHFLRRRKPISLSLTTVVFGASLDIALLLVLRGIFAHFPQGYWLAAVIVLIPFTVAGVFLAEVFSRYPQWSGRLYAWDLAGAAITAVAVVGLLQVVNAIDVCLIMAFLACLLAFVTNGGEGVSRFDGLSFGATILLVAMLPLNARTHLWDIPAVPPQYDADHKSLADLGVTQDLFTELGTPGHTSRIIDTRWNAFARTDVVDDSSQPGVNYVYTNGNVPTNMIQWDGDPATIGPSTRFFPLNDWCFAQAPLGLPDGTHHGRVLAIGPGGGLDALLSLHYGATQFDGAEINPSIVGLMRDYRKYNGGIYDRPDVHVVTAEGRAYVRQAIADGRHYSLLYSALTKTATAGQGMALLESFIYTKDAFNDYLNVLDDNGQVVIVCDQPILAARFFATAIATLVQRGIDERTARHHVAIVYNPQPGTPYAMAMVLQKSAFTNAETDAMLKSTLQRKLYPIYIPDQIARDDFGPYQEMDAGSMNLDGFIDWFRKNSDPPLNIEPCTDNRPFVLDLNTAQLPYFTQLTTLAVLIAIALAALGFWDARRDDQFRGIASSLTLADLAFCLYFFALGIGFMLIEIPLTQKLILPLGYPTLALTVILFSILLGGGFGSAVSQAFSGAKLSRWAVGAALAISIAMLLLLPVLDGLHISLLHLDLPIRCAAVALLLLPIGFLLGTPFPSGIRLFSERRPGYVPLIWGMNGVASVIGSLCAAMGARAWGFDFVLRLGALVYVIAAALIVFIVREQVTPSTSDDIKL